MGSLQSPGSWPASRGRLQTPVLTVPTSAPGRGMVGRDAQADPRGSLRTKDWPAGPSFCLPGAERPCPPACPSATRLARVPTTVIYCAQSPECGCLSGSACGGCHGCPPGRSATTATLRRRKWRGGPRSPSGRGGARPRATPVWLLCCPMLPSPRRTDESRTHRRLLSSRATVGIVLAAPAATSRLVSCCHVEKPVPAGAAALPRR